MDAPDIGFAFDSSNRFVVLTAGEEITIALTPDGMRGLAASLMERAEFIDASAAAAARGALARAGKRTQ